MNIDESIELLKKAVAATAFLKNELTRVFRLGNGWVNFQESDITTIELNDDDITVTDENDEDDIKEYIIPIEWLKKTDEELMRMQELNSAIQAEKERVEELEKTSKQLDSLKTQEAYLQKKIDKLKNADN